MTEQVSVGEFTGRIKWFNKKAGYGFITGADGVHKDVDIFIHHSGIEVGKETYKYLVQGEYVSFDVKEVSEGEHKIVGVNVRGVNGGMLMCETPRPPRRRRNVPRKRQNTGGDGGDVVPVRVVEPVKTGGRRGGRQGEPREEWVLMRRVTGGSSSTSGRGGGRVGGGRRGGRKQETQTTA